MSSDFGVCQPRIALSISHHFHNKENHAPLRKNPKTGTPSNTWAMGSGFQPVTLTLQAFVDHVISGKAWTPGIFRGARRRENLRSAHLLALDFDHNMSVERALNIPFIRQYAFLIYPSPSSTPDAPRSRVVFLLSEPVSHAKQWEALQRGLIDHLEEYEPDRACKDASRMYYGSTVSGAYTNFEAVLPLEIAGQLTQPQAWEEYERQRALPRMTARCHDLGPQVGV